MPFDVRLPRKLKAEGWKVKIREKEARRAAACHDHAQGGRMAARPPRQAVARAAGRADQGHRPGSDADHRRAPGTRSSKPGTRSTRRIRSPARWKKKRAGMKTTLEAEQRFVFLGSRSGRFKRPLPPRVVVCHDRSEVEAAVRHPAKRATWISFSRQFTDILLEKALTARAGHRGGHLLTVTPPRAESIPALLGLFHPVLGLVEGFRWLPDEELVEAITRDDGAERFIGGYVDPKGKALTLLRGNLEAVVTPLSIFQRSGDGTEPDFARLRLTDHGRTVALGDYEASADAILVRAGPAVPAPLNKQRRQSERTFGAALMRLRKQRRLKRSDFGPVSAKEIARIERNEVAKPHAKTLESIAARLGVRVNEIADY